MSSVLVVVDDEAFAGALARELNERSYTVIIAYSVSEAVEQLARHRPRVMLASLRLGSEDGIDLIQEARQTSHRTRTILMSANGTARDYRTAVEAGAVTVLCKPFEASELIDAVDLALECGSGFRGSLHGLSLIDLMQMFHLTRRSIRLLVTDGEFSGTISFRTGELVDARWREKVGVEALSSLLSSSYGRVETLPVRETEQTILGSFDSIVLDTLRCLDENGPASTRRSVQDPARPPSLVPPASVPSDTRHIAPCIEDQELAIFEERVQRAQQESLQKDWQVEVLRWHPSSEHSAFVTARLALAVDPTAAQIEVIREDRALGIILHGELAVVISSKHSDHLASQHFRTQFARFSAIIRTENSPQELYA